MDYELAEPKIHLYDRPYGRQERLTLNTASTVKIITILPYSHVSRHRHELRDEWWTVLDGPLDVVVGDHAWVAMSGDRVWIPRGTAHRAGNSSSNPGRLLEVSFGYFDENDIERLDGGYAGTG